MKSRTNAARSAYAMPLSGKDEPNAATSDADNDGPNHDDPRGRRNEPS